MNIIEILKFIRADDLTAGMSFGELAWIHSKRRGATIQALETPTEVIYKILSLVDNNM